MKRRFLLLLLFGVSVTPPFMQSAQKQPTSPKPPDKATVIDENVKQMLLLMDTDKNGKISREEWTKFMAAEFDRLDKDRSGELDPKELLRERMSFRGFHFAQQGK